MTPFLPLIRSAMRTLSVPKCTQIQAKKRRAQPSLSLEELLLFMQQLCNGVYMSLMVKELEMRNGL